MKTILAIIVSYYKERSRQRRDLAQISKFECDAD